jgi:hypothetical protein
MHGTINLPPLHASYQYGLNMDKITAVLYHKFSVCVAKFSYIIAELLSLIKSFETDWLLGLLHVF